MALANDTPGQKAQLAPSLSEDCEDRDTTALCAGKSFKCRTVIESPPALAKSKTSTLPFP